MTEEQKSLLNKVKNDFEKLWDGLCNLIPELNQLFSKKELQNLKKKYIAKLEALFEAGQKLITGPCLFDEYISACGTIHHSKEFIEEINCIRFSLKKVLAYANSMGNIGILHKIKQIIKELIITMDEDPSSKNPDYRNRFHELLVFNMLMECDNVEVTDIGYKLGTGKNSKDCDFRCITKDGKELLIEVMSIHNIDFTKQDDDSSFSEFINNKVIKKYEDKTKGLTLTDNLRILPIIKYNEQLLNFIPSLNPEFSLPLFVVLKNKIGERIESILIPVDSLRKNNI